MESGLLFLKFFSLPLNHQNDLVSTLINNLINVIRVEKRRKKKKGKQKKKKLGGIKERNRSLSFKGLKIVWLQD